MKILDFDLEGSHFIIEADISPRQEADDDMECQWLRFDFDNTQVYKETDGAVSPFQITAVAWAGYQLTADHALKDVIGRISRNETGKLTVHYICPELQEFFDELKKYPAISGDVYKRQPDKYLWSATVVSHILERMDYLGHTVNFKTHVKSYKNRKKIDNSPEQWRIFENTHEAIIDKETFEIVQKIRSGKRRPTKMGDMPMFSGLLYCADCGSKMTFHRQMAQSAEKHNFVCSNYRHNSKSCTMHYIRNVVVEQIVLENLKEVIRYVSDYEDEFVQMVMDTDMRQRNKELSQKKKRLTEIHSRIQELDKIFQRIYEDNISGKLSDERFMKLSKGYEEEQHTLQEEQTSLEKELQKEEKQSVDVKQFLSVVRKYTNLTELTPEIVHEFIDKIIVHAPDKSSGKRLQEIEIIYNHIGVFDHSKVTLWKGKAV